MLALFTLLNLFLYLVVWTNDFAGSFCVLILLLLKWSAHSDVCKWWMIYGKWIESVYIHLKWLENLLEISHYSFILCWLANAWATHESVLRLNLCVPKLCVEEMCPSCASIIMLQREDIFHSFLFIYHAWILKTTHNANTNIHKPNYIQYKTYMSIVIK